MEERDRTESEEELHPSSVALLQNGHNVISSSQE